MTPVLAVDGLGIGDAAFMFELFDAGPEIAEFSKYFIGLIIAHSYSLSGRGE